MEHRAETLMVGMTHSIEHRKHTITKFQLLFKLLGKVNSEEFEGDLCTLESGGTNIFVGNRLVGRMYLPMLTLLRDTGIRQQNFVNH